ncbi:YceI family protein [Flavobacterium sp. MAH-1]|uniref:YceI family protein n=1 Tax=Flavobacterium agri TaxID=2743471 RepID=A0A7Y8Y674_9FLAO|nr:YceI family protein [Flavobacterium agri]NUY82011.1 YceI family protein [Flavobacterium agri]NYA72035.1 YceI family protein [Flavobacterium agri]
MKKLVLLLLICASTASLAQDKILTKTGKITFEASTALEEIKATTTSATCIVNTTNGDIACLALQKSFRFKVALMEEHYNENYMESDKFPKATFKGNIEKFNYRALSGSAQDFTMKGILEMHGKTKEVTTVAKIRKVEGGTEIKAVFKVSPQDFGIEIPSVVKDKIAKTVEITSEFVLK